MTNDLSTGLLVVLSILAGLGCLLFLMTALDPTNDQSKADAHKAPRRPFQPRMATRAPVTPVQPIVMTEQRNVRDVG
jgi:hypothetical protein